MSILNRYHKTDYRETNKKTILWIIYLLVATVGVSHMWNFGGGGGGRAIKIW